MIKFIVGLFLGILITCMIYSNFYNTREIEHEIELYSSGSYQYRKGFETGTQWGIELQRHKEQMEREATE